MAAIGSWGTNALRIPLNEHCWLGVDDGLPTPEYVGETYRRTIQDIVQTAIANGLYPILDLHWSAPAGQPAIGQRPMPNASYSEDFWTSVADRFKGDTRVIFDLYNEPVPNNNVPDSTADAARRSWECWRDGGVASCDATLDLGTESTRMSAAETVGMRALVDAVRTTGATNVMMLGGIQWANTLWSDAAHNWLAYRPSDPLNNTVPAVHLYPSAWCIVAACYDAEIAPVAAQVPVVATEFGYPSCEGAASAWLETLMRWLDARAVGYLAWAWTTPHDEQDACTGLKLIASFSGTPTPYGLIYKTHLAGIPGETTTTLISSAPRSTEGQGVTFSAHVVSPSHVPAGNVVFALDGADVHAAALDDTGRAAFTATFVDDGAHSLVARYAGSAGFRPSASAALSHTVDNVAPAVELAAGVIDPLSVGTVFSVSSSFTDPGSADTHTATVDWGDGTTSAASIGPGRLTASHTYTAAGIYGLAVKVEDDDGGVSSSALASVIVFDRSAGFVGGLGHFESPAGAYAADAVAAGRATFAFAAWYADGAAVPSGKAAVAVRTARFTFDSTSYDWLVIKGARADLYGSGRVNGAGGYAFRLSVIDGGSGGGDDRLRLRIWNPSSGALLYDNQAGAPDDADPVADVAGAIAIRARGSD
jgi:endoglucanase